MTSFDRLAAKPLFMCSFRSFFLATALYGVLLLLGWLGFLATGIGLPDVPGGPIVWHAHELMFGFGLAAVAGFVLTAVPEFTATPAFGRRVTLVLLLCWAAARVAFWLSGVLGAGGAVLAALLNSGFMAGIVVLVAPRLWRDPERRHLSFLWGLAAMWLVVSGFHADVLRGLYPMRWVLAGAGAMMVLIVVAMSRVSMRIVNDALDAERLRRAAAQGDAMAGERPRLPGEDDDELPAYRARPPRRNLAVFGIAAHTLAEFALPGSPIAGWIALAAAAAVLNLLNDWHVGRALLTRWAFLLYAVILDDGARLRPDRPVPARRGGSIQCRPASADGRRDGPVDLRRALHRRTHPLRLRARYAAMGAGGRTGDRRSGAGACGGGPARDAGGRAAGGERGGLGAGLWPCRRLPRRGVPEAAAGRRHGLRGTDGGERMRL
ncbi:NnrS family protein [Thauera sp. SDU_THAU2]|uniref:NnrS family protein n=1 Tax=Thauera sp. SDU_THAU2 TaxID=3136633 RepID=UPI0040550CE3